MNVRQTMIAEAMNNAGEPHTIERLAPLLPDDFALEQIDLDEMPPLPIDAEFSAVEASDTASEQKTATIRAALQQLDTATDAYWTDNGLPREGVVRELANDTTISRRDIQSAWPNFRRQPATASMAVRRPETAVDEVAIAEAEARVAEATDALANARAAFTAAGRAEHDANGKLAREIQLWQAAFPAYTPRQLIRDHIASEQRTRAARVAGTLPPRPGITPGRSRIDQQRAYARGGEHSGNPGRAVCMDANNPGRIFPQNMKGQKVPSAR